MSVDALNGRMFDTAAMRSFGPDCSHDQEAINLACHVQRTRGIDARALDHEQLEQALEELRDGTALTMETHSTRACLCGSGQPWTSRLERLGKPTRTRCDTCRADLFTSIAEHEHVAPAKGARG